MNNLINISFFSNKRFQKAIIYGAGIFLFFGLFGSVKALTISPPRQELAGDPGSEVRSEFKVVNDSNDDSVFYTEVENFEAGDESGNPRFLRGKEDLAGWVNVQETVSLKAGEQKVIPFTINIPKSAEPGGYFASIFVRTTPPPRSGGGEVSIGAKLGTLLLLRVNGDIKEGVSILEFSTKDKQRFYDRLPVEFYYRFQNTGADRVKPEGQVVVKNLIGLTAKVLNPNISDGSVLPRSIRKFETAWATSGGGEETATLPLENQNIEGFFSHVKYQLTHFAFGYYTANLDIHFGENNNTASSKFGFLIIPWQLLIVAVSTLLILFVAFRITLKIYAKRIIKQHQNSMK